MSCFPCFSSIRSKKNMKPEQGSPSKSPPHQSPGPPPPETKEETAAATSPVHTKEISAQAFTFRDLATATKNFKQESLLGEGGFGRVYKGTLKASGKLVAVKQLDRSRMNENEDFMRDILILNNLKHPNLINLVGYCADGDQRLLVYEFVPGGSVEDRLHEKTPEKKPMDWTTRMKIAYGAAQALEYLHTTPSPPVVYCDLKASSILLDEDSSPKLSDIGLDKLGGTSADKTPAQSRMMGTYGYSAPEYSRSNQLTTESDVYSFGVVLLELITGRRAVDTTKTHDEQNLVSWAQPLFRDPKRYPDMADPLLKKQFPERDLNQVVAVASMCLQEEAGARPLMTDVVTTLGFLSLEPTIPPVPAADVTTNEDSNQSSSYSSTDEDEESADSEKNSKSSKHGSRRETASLSRKSSESDRKSLSSSRSSSSSDHTSRKLAQVDSVYLHCQSSQKSTGHSSSCSMSRQSTNESITKKSNHSSPSGSDDEHSVSSPPKDYSSFKYENGAQWSQGAGIDADRCDNKRSHNGSE